MKISQGDLSPREYDYLLDPTVGISFTVRGLNQPVNDAVTTVAFGKKPFDWMSEKQWQNLLVS